MFSVATDVSLLHSFSKGQHFNAIGQTVQYQYHFEKKKSIYVQVSYHTAGNYSNNLFGTAKNPLTIPQRLNYTASSQLHYRQFSVGGKYFFKGAADAEQAFNIYGMAGFGLLFAKVDNSFDKSVDTAIYQIPQRAIAGSATVRRLTFDVGVGGEFLLGGGIYFYTELRTWLPASDYQSPYLYNNDIPRVLMLNGGIRLLID